MKEFKVGDMIEITEVGGSYSEKCFSVGDIGKIIGCDEEGEYYIDFNNAHNKKVISDGIWYIETNTSFDDPDYAQIKHHHEKKPRFHDAHVGDDVYCHLNGYGYIHNFSDKDHNVFKVYFPETEIYEEYYSHGVLELHHKEPTLFYRKGEEKYLTERPEPEYGVDWTKVPPGTSIKVSNKSYADAINSLKFTLGYKFLGYFSDLELPFWVFMTHERKEAFGVKFCVLAEPCKPEWRK